MKLGNSNIYMEHLFHSSVNSVQSLSLGIGTLYCVHSWKRAWVTYAFHCRELQCVCMRVCNEGMEPMHETVIILDRGEFL